MQKNFDSEFCGSLPLNFINQVQPYGCLLVLDPESLQIVQASQNTRDMLGVDHEALVKKNIADYLQPTQAAQFKTKLQQVKKEKLPFTMNFKADATERHFLVLIHVKEDYVILEMEAANGAAEHQSSFISVYQELKYSMTEIQLGSSTKEVCDTAIRELKKVSGFDRVMIYQFDEQWNGTTIAEVLEEGMDPYLGLRFPASDIPKQARDLYLKNPYRLIPDRASAPVKLYPVINPITQSFTDLSSCNIRSIAGVHLEYLKNMNVTSSMSTRIVIDGKLWGLISCHHRTAKYLNYEMCSVFELLSEVISSKIAAIQREESFSFHNSLQDIQSALVEKLYTRDNIVSALFEGDKNILELLQSSGAVLVMNRSSETIGTTPSQEQVKDLVLWLQTNNIVKTFTTDSISQLYESGNQYNEVASGMIVLPIFPERGEYLIGFRPEVIQQVAWGGNPNEAIRFEADGKNYHPRNSFKLWQQTVQNTSLPWHSEEIAVAENFRNQMVESVLKRKLLGGQYN